jgi:hypothetical protein
VRVSITRAAVGPESRDSVTWYAAAVLAPSIAFSFASAETSAAARLAAGGHVTLGLGLACA